MQEVPGSNPGAITTSRWILFVDIVSLCWRSSLPIDRTMSGGAAVGILTLHGENRRDDRVEPYGQDCYLVRTMIKRLTRTGNSLALVLDKGILQATGINAETELEVSTDGDIVIISPVRTAERTERLRNITEDLDRAHAGAFRRLAE